MKLIKFIIAIAIVIGGLILLLPSLFNFDAVRTQLEEVVIESINKNQESSIKVDFSVNGPVEITFFPRPKLIVNNVELNNLHRKDMLFNAQVEKAELNLSVLKLLFGKVEVKKIALINSNTSLQMVVGDLIERKIQSINSEKVQEALDPKKVKKSGGLIEISANKGFEKLNKDSFSNLVKPIKKISFINGNIEVKDMEGAVINAVNKINVNFYQRFDVGVLKAKGNFEVKNKVMGLDYVINANIKGGSNNTYVKVYSDVFSLALNGKINTKSDSSIFKLENISFDGEIKSNIERLDVFCKRYLIAGSWLSRNVTFDGKVNSSAKITLMEGFLSVENINIKSEVINGEGSVKGGLLDQDSSLKMNLSFNNVDLNKLITSGSTLLEQRELKSRPLLMSEVTGEDDESIHGKNLLIFSIFKNLNIEANIKVNELAYLGEKVTDLSLVTQIASDNTILLNPLSFNIPGKGGVIFTGSTEYVKNLPTFNGKMEISGDSLKDVLTWLEFDTSNIKEGYGKQFSLTGDVVITTDVIEMNNIQSKFDDVSLIGRSKTDSTNRNYSYTNTDIIVDKINIDNYVDYDISKIISAGNDKTLLESVLWINSIKMNGNFSIKVNELTYKNKVFRDYFSGLEFEQGYFRASKIDAKSDDVNVRGFFSFDIRSDVPYLDVNLAIDRFVINGKTVSDGTIKTLSDNDGNQGNVNTQVKSDGNAEKDHILNLLLFSIPSLDKFDGRIVLSGGDIDTEKLKIKSFNFSGNLKGGNLGINRLDVKMYDGNIKIEGSLSVKKIRAFSGVFSVGKVSNQKTLSNTLGISNISGVSSISGSINAFGLDLRSFLLRMSGQVRIKSANVVIKEFGLIDLMNKMFQIRENIDELNDPLSILYNKDTETFLSETDVSMQFNKGGTADLKLQMKGSGLNGTFNGKLYLKSDLTGWNIDIINSIIFITGSLEQQIPINLVIKFTGDIAKPNKSTNIKQIEEYIRLIRESMRENVDSN